MQLESIFINLKITHEKNAKIQIKEMGQGRLKPKCNNLHYETENQNQPCVQKVSPSLPNPRVKIVSCKRMRKLA